ncbi:hypothetical protein ACHAQI_012313 [Fusarium lateritium]
MSLILDWELEKIADWALCDWKNPTFPSLQLINRPSQHHITQSIKSRCLNSNNAPISPTLQGVGIHQETSERRPIPGVTAAGVDSQQLINEIIADQEALNVATERYRQAAEAFHFWDTEIQKINGRMRTRERLSEVAGRNKLGD